ncbi:hypothetical protein ISN45_Aa07g006420 [Arabidopsis thaliana x Arabidopsis arenosa]|uniref:Uncharacterized protein n=1 Tax=Arabidopsis thaliana x Arabidopsis arenosa TaxID=1240361 RepID=A0A8T1Y7H9_9BRAS|nr:hypothetical protein ISN45_Aa07g006420 [Arabidopsis thaliana x Arabidopsis arenosa]
MEVFKSHSTSSFWKLGSSRSRSGFGTSKIEKKLLVVAENKVRKIKCGEVALYWLVWIHTCFAHYPYLHGEKRV